MVITMFPIHRTWRLFTMFLWKRWPHRSSQPADPGWRWPGGIEQRRFHPTRTGHRERTGRDCMPPSSRAKSKLTYSYRVSCCWWVGRVLFETHYDNLDRKGFLATARSMATSDDDTCVANEILSGYSPSESWLSVRMASFTSVTVILIKDAWLECSPGSGECAYIYVRVLAWVLWFRGNNSIYHVKTLLDRSLRSMDYVVIVSQN